MQQWEKKKHGTQNYVIFCQVSTHRYFYRTHAWKYPSLIHQTVCITTVQWSYSLHNIKSQSLDERICLWLRQGQGCQCWAKIQLHNCNKSNTNVLTTRGVLVFNWIRSKITPYQFNETVQRKTRIATAESTILGQRMCKMILLGCDHSVLILTLSLLLCSEPTTAIPWQEDLTAQLQQIQHQCTYEEY